MTESNLNIKSPFTYQHFLEKLVYYLPISLERIIGLQGSAGFIAVVDDNCVVLGDDKCLFGYRIKDLESLCMMVLSNVFEIIISQNQKCSQEP